ncbi:MAG: PAS domain S-box protein [Deltaproteobacteria bacterium]|nr:PAS domain S-box protein [Deltaproteobacteria bacterium]
MGTVRESQLALRKRLRDAERNLGVTRSILRSVLESVPDPVVVTDADGRVVDLNARARPLLSAHRHLGAHRRRAVELNRSAFAAALAQLDDRRRRELTLVDTRDGADVLFELLGIRGRAEPVTFTVAVLRDVTELRRAMRETEDNYLRLRQVEAQVRTERDRLEQLLREHVALEQASASKSQFLANLSHELRTPLNAILGYTSMLLGGVGGAVATAAQRRYLERVDASSRHLLSLIEDVLDFTRIEAGRMPMRLTEVSLPAVVRGLLAEVEPLVRRAGLTVVARVPRTLPALRTDRQKLRQILLNLLVNAVKFTPRGTVEVSASHIPAHDQICISVTDTGIGIADDQQAHVFESFRQVDSSPTRQRGGVGLGLAIARRLAEMLGGTLELSSKLGEGSTFTLTVPRRARARRTTRR